MIFHNSNEEYPQPLSMFSEEEWKGMEKATQLTMENWKTFFPNGEVVHQGYKYVDIEVSELGDIYEAMDKSSDNLINNGDDIRAVINIGKQHHLVNARFFICISNYNDDRVEYIDNWKIESIDFYFKYDKDKYSFFTDSSLAVYVSNIRTPPNLAYITVDFYY